jgi:hypothetical protein
MARHLRVEFPGTIYHVGVRMLGNWKGEENLLIEDDADRERFLSCLVDLALIALFQQFIRQPSFQKRKI